MALSEERAPAGGATRAVGRRDGHGRSLGRLPELSVLVAMGVLLVATAYAAGATATGAAQLFWAGQLLVFLPVALRFLYGRPSAEREAFGLVLLLALANYVIKYCYSPLQFKFPDELEHWRTAENILATGHLFGTNESLPISPYYPGLESITTAVASLTGLSVFAAGIVVVGIAHLLLAAGLYLLFRQISGSLRIAGIASVLYTANPHYQFFDAMFLYQALALPFLVLAVQAAVRITAAPRSRSGPWWLLALTAAAVTVISHHVTSYVLVATLLLAALAFRFRARGTPGSGRLAALAGVTAAMTALWVAAVAPTTGAYLRPALASLVDGVTKLASGTNPADTGSLLSPISDRVATYLGLLVVALCLPIGWSRIRRAQRHRPWVLAMAVGSATYYATLVLRLTSSDGTELSGRALTYVFVPVAFVLAVAAEQLPARLAARTSRRGTALAVGTALIALPAVGGLAGGWPPFWERLPGRFQVGGYENSVGPEGIAAAQWSLAALGPDNRFAADLTDYTLLGTYGRQDAVRNGAPLYQSPAFRNSDANLVQSASIRYVLVDHRLTEQLPASGSYFTDDPNADRYTRPLSPAALDKFDHVQGVSRVYDSGNIVIYDLEGSPYAP